MTAHRNTGSQRKYLRTNNYTLYFHQAFTSPRRVTLKTDLFVDSGICLMTRNTLMKTFPWYLGTDRTTRLGV